MTDQDELSVDSPNQPNSFSITESMLLSLRQTKPWARLLSVLGFIFIGLMVISGAISMIAFFKVDPKVVTLPMVLISGVFNIMLGLLYFFHHSFFLSLLLQLAAFSTEEARMKWRKYYQIKNLFGNSSAYCQSFALVLR